MFYELQIGLHTFELFKDFAEKGWSTWFGFSLKNKEHVHYSFGCRVSKWILIPFRLVQSRCKNFLRILVSKMLIYETAWGYWNLQIFCPPTHIPKAVWINRKCYKNVYKGRRNFNWIYGYDFYTILKSWFSTFCNLLQLKHTHFHSKYFLFSSFVFNQSR